MPDTTLRFTAIDGDRRTGRSTRLMAYATAIAEVHPQARILVMAPRKNQLHHLARLAGPVPASVGMTFATPGSDLVRGRIFDFAFVDDADFIDPDALYAIEAVTRTHLFIVRGLEK